MATYKQIQDYLKAPILVLEEESRLQPVRLKARFLKSRGGSCGLPKAGGDKPLPYKPEVL